MRASTHFPPPTTPKPVVALPRPMRVEHQTPLTTRQKNPTTLLMKDPTITTTASAAVSGVQDLTEARTTASVVAAVGDDAVVAPLAGAAGP